MFKITASASFDSAHFLTGYHGKCANLHGHRWKIEVTAGGDYLRESGEQRGMVMDFGVLKREVKELADSYDHAFIYEDGSLRVETVAALKSEQFRLIAVPYRPTAENFASAFYWKLRQDGIPVLSVTVYESPENAATYSE